MFPLLLCLVGCGGVLVQEVEPKLSKYGGIPVYLKQAARRETWRYKVPVEKAAALQEGFIGQQGCLLTDKIKVSDARLIAHEVTFGAEPRYDKLYQVSAEYMLWGTRTLDVKLGEDGTLGEAAATSIGTGGADLASFASGVGAITAAALLAPHPSPIFTDAPEERAVVSCSARAWWDGKDWGPTGSDVTVTSGEATAKKKEKKDDKE